MSIGCHPDHAREFLDRHVDLRHIQLMLTDLNGVLRGKSVRRHELERIYTEGLPLPGAALPVLA